MHTRVKFKTFEDGTKEDVPKGWHLLTPLGDGEYTACGNATPEYETVKEDKEKGGITCPDCLEAIKFYKAIQL